MGDGGWGWGMGDGGTADGRRATGDGHEQTTIIAARDEIALGMTSRLGTTSLCSE